jgi:uncharacterized membrane protein YdjX (TVP38/TMEM64 family)
VIVRRVLTALRAACFVLLAAAVAWALWHRADFDAAALEARIRSFGPWAPAVFVAAYALATVLFAPGSVLSLTGGALFGPVWGTLYNLAGATLGATLAFLAARYLVGDWVARRLRGRLRQLVEAAEAEGWRFAAFVRLVPVFPFNLLNYALGLTRLSLPAYVLTTLVCIVPGTVAYTYLGYAGREALAGGEGLARKGLLALGLLAAAVFLPLLVRRLRLSRAGGGQAPVREGEPQLGTGPAPPAEAKR